MHKPPILMPKLHSSTIPALILLLVWFAGLSLGFTAARFYGGTLADLIVQSAAVSGSPFGMILPTMLPLLLSAFAVTFFDSRGIYSLCLLRGLGLGVMLGAVCDACAGGWLLGLLLLFSALLYSPVLMWYWMRRVCGCGGIRRDTSVALAIGLAVSVVDGMVIAPFLAYAITL